ncbi:hypothetical protein glysoja_043402 [Glycine soja]|uniref:Uncharacterized protein n=1 Tax=Glycine soja TaxID=3848 RepID=A0A0B2S9N4_GLYSO|nr:hypothetical protein glysoja_043402 [Glycine soja]
MILMVVFGGDFDDDGAKATDEDFLHLHFTVAGVKISALALRRHHRGHWPDAGQD